MRARDYTHAVLELIHEGMSVDEAFRGLTHTLKKRDHHSLYPSILRELERNAEKMITKETATLTLAKKDDESKFKAEIIEALALLGTSSHTVHTDSTITGGFILEGNEKRIDESYKKKLLTLYRSLTASR
jgi:F0F1-type ATP synthase delta subunit